MKRIERYDIEMALNWQCHGSLRDELTDEATIAGGVVESITCDGENFIVTVVPDEDQPCSQCGGTDDLHTNGECGNCFRP